jgi:hypothetical protein
MSSDHVIIEIDRDSVRPERLRAGAPVIDLEQGPKGEGLDGHPYAEFHHPQHHSSMENLIPVGAEGSIKSSAVRG